SPVPAPAGGVVGGLLTPGCPRSFVPRDSPGPAPVGGAPGCARCAPPRRSPAPGLAGGGVAPRCISDALPRFCSCMFGGPPGLPRSNGEGETAAGDLTVAAGGTRPGSPRGPGETGGAPPPRDAGFASAAGDAPPGARAPAAVGGGTFVGFSALIFCFSSASF